MRSFLVASLCALLSLLCVSPDCSALISGREERNISGYRIVRFATEWNGKFGHVLQIWKGNRKLVEHKAHDVWIYSMDKQADSFELGAKDPVVVEDLTGDGAKDLIIQEWSGGAHGAYKFDIYSLGKSSLSHMWNIDAGNGHLFIRRRPGRLPQLLVEDDQPYVFYGDPLDQMPIDVYEWSAGKFRRTAQDVPREKLLPARPSKP